MSKQTLTDQAVETLGRMGATENLSVEGSVITAADKWGDRWTILVASDADSVDVADLLVYKEDGSRLVLAVPRDGEAAGRAKLASAGIDNAKVAPNAILVWGL